MSARCIPIVFAAGGPASTVEDGITGFHFQTIEQLAAKTQLVFEEMPIATLEAIADTAEAKAASYSEPIFEEQVRSICFKMIDNWEDTVGSVRIS